MPAIASTSGRSHSEFIRLLFLQTHWETDRFFEASGVQVVQSTSGAFFHLRRAAFFSNLKSKSGNLLTITPKSHTHPLHSQTSRLLTSSLSLGVPVPRHTHIEVFSSALALSIHNKQQQFM